MPSEHHHWFSLFVSILSHNLIRVLLSCFSPHSVHNPLGYIRNALTMEYTEFRDETRGIQKELCFCTKEYYNGRRNRYSPAHLASHHWKSRTEMVFLPAFGLFVGSSLAEKEVSGKQQPHAHSRYSLPARVRASLSFPLIRLTTWGTIPWLNSSSVVTHLSRSLLAIRSLSTVSRISTVWRLSPILRMVHMICFHEW